MSKNLIYQHTCYDMMIIVVDVRILNPTDLCLHLKYMKELFCGGYRSRTDDPLRARQML